MVKVCVEPVIVFGLSDNKNCALISKRRDSPEQHSSGFEFRTREPNLPN